MGYQSKTYSLSDEVIGLIEMARANGESPNKFLRRILGIDNGEVIVRPGLVQTPTPVNIRLESKSRRARAKGGKRR